MTGNVAELNNILAPEGLAKSLSMMYEDFYAQRQNWKEQTKETRDFIFATDNTSMVSGNYPWRNTIHFPKLTQIRDNLHANYLSAAFPNDNWLKWEAYSEEAADKAKRNAIQAYMENKTREGGFRQTISQLLLDYIDYGNAFADVIWVNESSVDPETNEPVPGYIGPKVIRLSPLDILFNPIATSFEKSPKITRVMISIGELKIAEKELNLDPKIVQEAVALRRQAVSYKTADWDKAEGMLIDGFGNLQSYYQGNTVELLKFEGDINDFDSGEMQENRIIWVLDRRKVVSNEPNPSWLARSNKAHVSWRQRPDNLYGMGPLDNLIGMQYQINKLANSMSDALDQYILPPKVIKGDVDTFEWAPNAEIHIDEDGDVDVFRPDLGAIFTAQQEINLLEQRMEEYAGAPKQAMGIRTPGEKTAFEVGELMNAASRIFQNKITNFEVELIEPLLNTMLEVARRNMDGADLVRIMDDDLGVAEFIAITKDDITAKGKLRAIGARHFAARSQMIQSLAQLSNTPIYQDIKPHISGKKMAEVFEDLLQIERFGLVRENIAIEEQLETQRLVNQGQEELAVEATAPVEEEAEA